MKKASPRPISKSPTWAAGAKSPLAPTDPFSGTTGVAPWFKKVTRYRSVSMRTPPYPRDRSWIRKAIMARTTSSGRGFPTPAAWLMRMFSWSFCVSFLDMVRLQSAPKPVVMP